MKVKRWIWMLLATTTGYIGLLVLLTVAEQANPESSIQSFTDALWYSIVTLSTVGYGDLYPVTLVGTWIGVIFVLLSVGALAFLVGAVVQLFTGQMLPRLQLRLLRGKQWYLFSEMNDMTLALAQSLKALGGVVLFPVEDREKAAKEESFAYYPGAMEQIVAGKGSGCTLFYMAADGETNYERALSAMALGHPIHCCTEQVLDACPENLHLFDGYACCARDYWNRHPLCAGEENVILIGSGRYARELLEQGLCVNVFDPNRRVRYHLFGDWMDFRRNHPCLGDVLQVDQDGEEDSLFFHTDAWNADGALLCNAQRIVLCGDDAGENMQILRQLRRYFPVSGKVHLRARQAVPGETVFGTDDQVYTMENVLLAKLTWMARCMHGIYLENAPQGTPDWRQLSEFTRQSNMAAADHLPVKVRLLLEDETILTPTAQQMQSAYERFAQESRRDLYRQIEHRRWMRFHGLHNWRYGPVRNNGARIHPMMQPFEDLSEAEQAKDDYAWQLLAKMAQEMERILEDN